jgi:hypothetical protein
VLFDRDSFARMATDQGLHVKSFAYAQGAPFWTVSVLNELRLLGLVKISRERPSIYHPLVPLLQGLFAGLDILRSPIARLTTAHRVCLFGTAAQGRDCAANSTDTKQPFRLQ